MYTLDRLVCGWGHTGFPTGFGGKKFVGHSTVSCMSIKFSSFEYETIQIFKFSGGEGGIPGGPLCMKPWGLCVC